MPNKKMNNIEQIIYRFALRYQRKKKYPATVILAKYNGQVNIDKSGAVPNNLSQQLRISLNNIGKIGQRINGGNFLGKCSEIRASNPILLNNPTIQTGHIIFSSAYRPRTMQIITTCNNCINTF